MSDELKAALIRAEVAMTESKVQGLVADNRERELAGCTLAYDSRTFFAHADELQQNIHKILHGK